MIKYKHLEYVEFSLSHASIYPFEGVYMIGDNLYIGQSINLFFRIQTHIDQAIKGTHCNKKLQAYIRTIIEYDVNFMVTFLSPDIRDEFRFITQYKPEFNITAGIRHPKPRQGYTDRNYIIAPK